jgi:hypothetical protein
MKTVIILSLIGVISFPICSMAEDSTPVTLNNYADVPTGINTAIVVDRQGTTLGVVAKVERNSAGGPSEVDVVMPGGRRLQVGASSAVYDSMSNRVIADTPVLETAQAARGLRG